MKQTKIVFIGYGILGDFIVCLKSLELLREKFPEAHITYVGNKTFAQLGLDDYHINEIIETDDELKKYYYEKGHSSEKWETLFSKTNLLINHPMDPEGVFVQNMAIKGFTHQTTVIKDFKLRNETKVLLHGEVQNTESTAYEQVAELLCNLDIGVGYYTKWTPELRLPESLLAKAKERTDKLLDKKKGYYNSLFAFHPGASTSDKCMPLMKWKEVLSAVVQEDDYILVFIGPAEYKLLPELKVLLKEFNTLFTDNYSLKEEVAILKYCDVFLGHDTGFAHIASALNVSSVLVFGPHSLVNVWKPPSVKAKALFYNNLRDANTKEISEEIKSTKKNKLAEELVIVTLKDEDKALRLIRENPEHNYLYYYSLNWVDNIQDIDFVYYWVHPEIRLNRKKYNIPHQNLKSYPDARYRVDSLFFAVYMQSEKLVEALLKKSLSFITYIQGYNRCGEHYHCYLFEIANESIFKLLSSYFKEEIEKYNQQKKS